MARSLVTLIAICALGAIWTTAASALPGSCNTQLSSSANSRTVSADSLDQSLFNDAVLYYVNVERCNRGLVPLSSDNNLIRATRQHSADMARNAYISHNSKQAGYRSLQDRLSKARVSYRVAGENVAKSFVFAFNRKNIGTSAKCQFRFSNTGGIVPRHTYDSLAKDLVVLWMESPTHRSNILYRDYRRAGATIGINNDPSFCGTVYVAQNFTN
mgnify:CR=1 FL=1